MITQRRSLFVFAVTLGLAGLMVTGCGKSFPDCENDQSCVDYNRDNDSDGYNRNLTVCVDGTCRQCADDSNCGTCQSCNNNVCEAIPGCCGSTSDCPSGQICQDDACVAGCDSTRPCQPGQLCENNRCTDDPNWCDLDGDCAAGFRCENNRCVDDSPCADREFEAVYFDFDESVIRADQESRLESNLECLGAFPGDDIRIEGHADERGTDAYNLALGERRARSHVRYLERLGVDDDRLDVISYGESRPVCRQSNESCWRRNRRTESSWR